VRVKNCNGCNNMMISSSRFLPKDDNRHQMYTLTMKADSRNVRVRVTMMLCRHVRMIPMASNGDGCCKMISLFLCPKDDTSLILSIPNVLFQSTPIIPQKEEEEKAI
jgi:hypothetical protein